MSKLGIRLSSIPEDHTNNFARMYSSPFEMKTPVNESIYFPCKHETMKDFDKYSNCKNCGVYMNKECGTFGYKTKKAAYSSLFPVVSVLKTMYKDDDQLNSTTNQNYLKSRSSTIDYIFDSASILGLSLNSAYLSILYLDKTISHLLPSSLPFSSPLPSSSFHHASSLNSNPTSSFPSPLSHLSSPSLPPTSSISSPPSSSNLPISFSTKLCAGTLLLIAAKAIELDERIPFIPKMRNNILAGFLCDDIKKCEGKLLECLDWKLQKTTVFDVLEFFMSQGVIFKGDCIDGKEVGRTEAGEKSSLNGYKRGNIEGNRNGMDANKNINSHNNESSQTINGKNLIGENTNNTNKNDNHSGISENNVNDGSHMNITTDMKKNGEKEVEEGEQKFAVPFVNEENRSKIWRNVCLERKIYDTACLIEKDLVRLCGMIIKDNDFVNVSMKTLAAAMIAFIRKTKKITPTWNIPLEHISDGIVFSHLETTLQLITYKYSCFFSIAAFDSMTSLKTFNFASKQPNMFALTEIKQKYDMREQDVNCRQVNSTYQKQNLSLLNQKNSIEVVTSNFEKNLKSTINYVHNLQMKKENSQNESKVKNENIEANLFKSDIKSKNENLNHLDSKIENFGLNFGNNQTSRNLENTANLGPILKDAENKMNIEGGSIGPKNIVNNLNRKNLSCFSDENNHALTVGQLSRKIDAELNFSNQAKKETNNGKLL